MGYLGQYAGPDGTKINSTTQVKDLGVIISNDGKFEQQIDDLVKKARSQTGWILRVFETREETCMITLFRSLILPLVEYCCQLWSPRRIGLIRRVETIQRSFTFRIRRIQHMNYWDRLAQLKLYSLERRRERYFIIYTWKMINGLVPNINEENMSIRTRMNERRGLTCLIPNIQRSALQSVQTMKEESLLVHGPRLFNVLPRELRVFSGTLETFKLKLDKFLQSVPDKPALPHYQQSASSNSLLDQIAHQRVGRL